MGLFQQNVVFEYFYAIFKGLVVSIIIHTFALRNLKIVRNIILILKQ